ncbi:ribonuclease Z [Butyrivibrio hungatei DSM 14810]|uniref:Ribonuclease Z n=1 Tax=Butyrivibrio hungatei DSM 14810 TaxID=1121132 RepID=A0A1M7SZY7_9FIRM|nr:ribonuclease Z [Butyrivibrio hungatei]MCR4758143.1 ribonuclease Z [Butyrivibrio sp.]SHN63957.1 ribonuclease Z [Butyrivibrio hungatei DSM 14810]
MIDVCLLGTGGMMPLPNRFLTSLNVRYNGKCVLIDCGEATQIAMKKKGISAKPIDIICFTHYHADHISGLPGLLLTMGNAERTEPLLMIGPKGLEKVVNSLRVIAPELPFEIKFKELTEPEVEFEPDPENMPGFSIKAFRVNHNITCYGYSMSLKRQGKFNVEAAQAAGIDRRYWNSLQKGAEVTTEDGRVFTPDMVLGEARKGIKLTYVTDTRPTDSIVANAAGSDLFICEGMYGEPDKIAKAREYKHMTFYEAAKMAKSAEVKEMWLTHYSPSLVNPAEFMQETKKIFANTVAAKDGRSVELRFED